MSREHNREPIKHTCPDIDKYIYMKNNILYSSTYNDNPKSILDVTNSQLYEHPFEYMAIVLSSY